MVRPLARHAAWILCAAMAGCTSSMVPVNSTTARGPNAPSALHRGFQVLYRFHLRDGNFPEAGLIALNGTLYGTTISGGNYGMGTIYAVTGSQVVERVIYSFPGYHFHGGAAPAAPLLAIDGALFGTTYGGGNWRARNGRRIGHIREYGTVFKFVPPGSNGAEYLHLFEPKAGSNPDAGLVEAHGKLYGTASIGGSHAQGGVVYELSLTGSHYRVVHRFEGSGDGSGPQAGLLEYKGAFYGTTQAGGTSNDGTVYKLVRSGGEYRESIVYSFAGGDDGAGPVATLTEMGGALYDTTVTGGGSTCSNYGVGCGTVFKLAPTASGFTESVIHRFGGSPDGGSPFAGLTVLHGNLYGTTNAGGNRGCLTYEGCGTIFEVAPAGSGYSERILHRFDATDGYRPSAGLTLMNGILYGAAAAGGGGTSCNCGDVFSIEP